MTSTAAVARCSACDAQVDAASTCPACGSPVLPATRRFVTVLFVDLVGYTRLCSELDVEVAYRLVRPLMNGLRAVCESLGGVVPGIEGDGFMAVFGAKTAFEDDPRRAVLAAVEMQRYLRIQRETTTDTPLPAMRIGINVGEALVAPSWERAGFSVSGDVVNVASRLCQVASEGGVLGSSELVQFVPLVDAWGRPQDVVLRNRTQAVEACDLAWDALERPDFTFRDTSGRAFVARPQLLADVRAALESQGSVQIVGEAGTGKTRLAEAVVSGARALAVLRCGFSSFPSGRNALSELLDEVDVTGIPGLTALDRRRLTRLTGGDVDTVEVDTSQQQLDALLTAVAAVATTRSTLLMLDDVHWADAEDVAFLGRLISELPTVPVILIARSEVPLAAPMVEVRGLEGEELSGYLDALLPGASAEVRRFLVERAGGSPFYLEQCASLLLENGALVREGDRVVVADADRLRHVPVVMRPFLESRIDLLPERSREVLRTAAVVGDDVDPALLSYLCGTPADLTTIVNALVDRGFLVWHRRPSDEASLRFRHQLLRDVAYDGILRSRRRALHLAASEWYAVLPVVQLLAAEAAHLEAAIAMGERDCGVVRRAVEVLTHFALSTAEERTVQAQAALARGRALAEAHPRCEVDLLELVLAEAQVFELRGAEAEAARAALDAVRQAQERERPDLRARAQVLAARALILTDRPRADELLAAARAHFVEAGDPLGEARVDIALAHSGDRLGDRLAAYARAFRAAEIGGDARLSSLAAQDLAQHFAIRDPQQAGEWLRRSEQVLRADDAVGRARIATSRAVISAMRMELTDSVAHAAEAVAIVKEAGAQQLLMFAALFQFEAAVLLGDLALASELRDALHDVAQERPTDHLQVDAGLVNVLLLSRTGRAAQARDLLEDLAPQAEVLGPAYVEEWATWAARLHLETGRYVEAVEAAARAVNLSQSLDMPAYTLRNVLLSIKARLVAGHRVGLSEFSELRSEARQAGADPIAALAARWSELADTLTGFAEHAVDLPDAPDLAEARALDQEILALRWNEPDRLLEAAAEWRSLGTTAWEMRSLCWHSELTGAVHPAISELSRALGTPPTLEAQFRAQMDRFR